MKPSPTKEPPRSSRRRLRPTPGFSVIELVTTIAVGMILAAIAIPMVNSAMATMRINAAVSQFEGALSSSRFQAIKNSQPYTFVLTAPANTYVLTNTATGAANNPVPMSSYVNINGGTAGTYTYTLCPNGMVYGAGGCPSVNAPPALSFTYQGRQINTAVSGVGNVTTTIIK